MSSKKQWYKVVFEESVYDDLIGSVVDIQDRTIILDFGKYIGQARFYKYQVVFEGEY